MAKTKPWMKASESEMLDQFDQFTLKLPGYIAKYGLTAPQATAARNDYLWLRYAITCAQQFEQEWRNRVIWKNQLKDGPKTSAAALAPGVGSEFVAPVAAAVPDGVLVRWRELVAAMKGHLNYDKADGTDLGVEAPLAPAQSMKPVARCQSRNHGVEISVRKDGHEAVITWCQRGSETAPVKLGTYTRAVILDERPNLVAGQPEVREYTFQYCDGDVAVGEVSDVCRVTTLGWQAAA